MDIRTNLKKIGSSHHFLVPSSILKVYSLHKYFGTHDYKISVTDDGKTICFTRAKKQSAEEIVEDINNGTKSK